MWCSSCHWLPSRQVCSSCDMIQESAGRGNTAELAEELGGQPRGLPACCLHAMLLLYVSKILWEPCHPGLNALPCSALAVQESGGRGEDLTGVNPKRERIKHAIVIAAKLPGTFSTHASREMQVLVAAEAFRHRWMTAPGGCAGRLAPCVTLLNECGVEKAVCMTLRWAALPHTELHDLDNIAQVRWQRVGLQPVWGLAWYSGTEGQGECTMLMGAIWARKWHDHPQ